MVKRCYPGIRFYAETATQPLPEETLYGEIIVKAYILPHRSKIDEALA